MSIVKTRNSTFDFLKFIGLSAIILAHVSPPSFIMMIRSFDVPLMVILSAILAKPSYKRHIIKAQKPINYIVSRAKRLAFPTWIFLTVYFILLVAGTRKSESIKYYLASYALTRYGIGYVWIILIYIYTSILVPILSKTPFSIKSFLCVTLAYATYEVCYYLQFGIQSKVFMTTFYYIIPYGALAFLGYHYTSMNFKTKVSIAIIFMSAFVVLAIYYWSINGSFQLVNIVKYPPRLYYLSYGITCSFFLLIVCERYTLKLFNFGTFEYISTHSMWIYLWHILWLKAYDVLHLPQIWFLEYATVYTGALLTVLIVNKLIDLIEKHFRPHLLKYMRG